MSHTAPRPAALAALREFDQLRNPEDSLNGPSMADTLARAEEATTLLKQNYTVWAREDVEKGQRHLDDATGDPARAPRTRTWSMLGLAFEKPHSGPFRSPSVRDRSANLTTPPGGKSSLGGMRMGPRSNWRPDP